MRARLAVLATSVALLACDGPATGPVQRVDARGAVTHGELDGAGHPAVVLIIMDVGGKPAFRCSGTLIAPKVVLTAGHCAGEPGEFSGLRVFTESDVENGNNNYPFSGPNTIEAAEWRAHPQYTNAAFFLHDALQPRSSTLFTAVGYGLQRVNPAMVEDELIRMRAEPHLVQINTGFTGDFSILLSNNASTGGTCFGDSGGPNYLGSSNVVAGVTSFGLNGSCGGTGGVFRVDRKNVLDFVNQFLR
jgi:secreted trypsin-like serine protease